MSEGTKLGEFKESTEFKPSVKPETQGKEELKATKIGELSEFEKSLYSEEELAKAAESTSQSKSESSPVEEKSIVESSTTEAEQNNSQSVQETSKQTSTDQPLEKKDESANSSSANNAMSNFEQELDRLSIDIQEGDIITGIVRKIEKGGVLVDIGYKSDGFVANEEFSNDPKLNPRNTLNEGDDVIVSVLKLESREGYTMLSRKRAEFETAWNTIIELAKTKDAIDVRVISKVEGGLVASFMGINGFIPASQLSYEQDDELEGFLKKDLTVSVLRADRKRRKIIFSHKLARNKQSKEESFKILDDLEIGQVREGKVTSIKDFGAFIDLGGVEGLVHISELSWARVAHPTDVLNMGDDVKVFVLGIDKESRRISLGMKQLEPDPWVEAGKKYAVGQVVEGEVTRVVPFGAFVKLEDNLEGLVHISELSHQHIKRVEDVVNPGDKINAKIIKIVPDEQKIGLSLKEAEEEQSSESAEQTETQDQGAEPKAELDDTVAESGAEPEPKAETETETNEESTQENNSEETSPVSENVENTTVS